MPEFEEGKIYLTVSKGAGSFIKGDRVKWCDGLDGTVLGVWKSFVMIETDDGITRMAGEEFIDYA